MTQEEAEELVESIRDIVEYWPDVEIGIRAHVDSSGNCGWCVVVS